MLRSSGYICLEVNFVLGHGEIIREIYGRFVYIIVCIIRYRYCLPARVLFCRVFGGSASVSRFWAILIADKWVFSGGLFVVCNYM